MKHTTTTVKYVCDVCSRECTPITNIRMIYAYFMDQFHAVDMKVSLDVPYSKDEHHICLSCLIKYMQKYIRSHSHNTEVQLDDF